MKSKNMTLMVVAIGCGLVAAFLTAKLSGGGGPEMVDVIIAKKELIVGTVLDEKELENMIGTQKVQKTNLPPDIINNADELKGKKLNRTLKMGNFFSAGDVGADNGIKLPEGLSKYSIKIDGVSAVSGFVNPGDKVDVILTESMANGKAKSGIFLRDMLVLAVDATQNRREGGQAQAQVNSVSMAVTPEQSLVLSSAEKRGQVKLLLRDPKNPDKNEIAAVTEIKGFDKSEATNQPVAPLVKTAVIFVAKVEIPQNTLITTDNINSFFAQHEVPEEGLSNKTVRDQKVMIGKYVKKDLEADQPVFSTQLSDDKIVTKVEVAAKVEVTPDELEVLPQPREVVVEKSPYPRKFEQIINNQRVFFIEMGPGQFRRVDGGAEEIKDLPHSDGKPIKKEEKTEVLPDGRAV